MRGRAQKRCIKKDICDMCKRFRKIQTTVINFGENKTITCFPYRRIARYSWKIFWQGFIQKEFAPECQTTIVYTFTERFLKDSQKRDPISRATGNHNNASCHTVISTKEFLVCKNVVVAPQPSYSLNFSTRDFFLREWTFIPRNVILGHSKTFDQLLPYRSIGLLA